MKDGRREKVTCVWQMSPGDLTFFYRFEESHRTYTIIFILALAARKLRVMVCVQLK